MMQMIKKVLNSVCKLPIAVLIIIIVGCSSSSTVLIEMPTKLLKNPYPIDYPSTNPQPNEIVSILKVGDQGRVLDITYGKDYRVYKVKMNDGKTGYLVGGDTFKILTDRAR